MRFDYTKITDGDHLIDEIVNYFIKADRPSRRDGSSSCRYRLNHEASDPVCCAVGYFIPDTFYTRALENLATGYLAMGNDPFGKFVSEYHSILQAAQALHDQLSHWDELGFNAASYVLLGLSLFRKIPWTTEQEQDYLDRFTEARNARKEATNAL